MKRITLRTSLLFIAAAFIVTSCTTPVTLTSWKNPKENVQIGNVMVWAMFDKLEYQKPFEQYACNYFGTRGMKAIQSLSFLPPGQKYELNVLEKKFDSLGVDGILIISYKGTDKSESYVPQTVSVYPDYYNSYYGYYNYGYSMYGGYGTVSTGGYWVTSSVIHLKATLYDNADNNLLWTADITVTDPQYIDEASYRIASEVYADWQANNLLKAKTKK
jgi:hypothetical protein